MTRNRGNQGQVIIVAALVLVIMLLSTALFIADLQKNQLRVQGGTSLNLPFYKQGVRNTVISALANISGGGSTGVLEANLNTFNSFVEEHSAGAFFQSKIALGNTAPYNGGVWMIQNVSGKAVLSAFVGVSVNSTSPKETCNAQFDVNVTSTLETQGHYTLQNETKLAELTCKIFNDGQAASAKNFTVSFERDGSLAFENWTSIEQPSIVDHGDGSYTITFTATTDQPENPLLIWVSCQDRRGITLQTLVEPALQ